MKIRDAEKLGKRLLFENGLTDWKIVWNKRWKRQGGRCWRIFKQVHLGVEVCKINDEDGMRELILHEIAHALAPGGHGREWREMAMKIGCSGSRHPKIQWPERKWLVRCEWCGFIGTSHVKIQGGWCKRCAADEGRISDIVCVGRRGR